MFKMMSGSNMMKDMKQSWGIGEGKEEKNNLFEVDNNALAGKHQKNTFHFLFKCLFKCCTGQLIYIFYCFLVQAAMASATEEWL